MPLALYVQFPTYTLCPRNAHLCSFFLLVFASTIYVHFFFLPAARVLEGTKFTVHILFRYCSRIVYGTHSFYSKNIYILKMGSTVLFTHLKFILLQCFQFSAK